MSKYYFQIKVEENNTASMKAKLDIEKILNKQGYCELYKKNGNFRFIRFIRFFISILKIMLQKNIVLVCQYPFISKVEFNVICLLKKFKKIKLISIVHDLNSLRDIDDCKKSITEEIDYINKNDYIISHNNKMNEWLKENGAKTEIMNLDIFDYLSYNTIKIKKDNDFKRIYFAGNLDKIKSKFIYTEEMRNLNISMKLFGPNYSDKLVKCSNITYGGVFPAEQLADKFEQGFGLIWDGSSIEKCDGKSGEYLKYNTPHKTSLYLSSGIPVIIWEEAAMKNFVEKYKVGFTIKSLKDIEQKFNTMTYDQYMEFQKNSKEVGEKLLKGYFTTKAIKNIEQTF